MPITILNRSYYRADKPFVSGSPATNRLNAIIGNVLNDFTMILQFDWNFNILSSTTNIITLNASVGSTTQVNLLTGNFMAEGYASGQAVTFNITTQTGGNQTTTTINANIISITPTSLVVDADLGTAVRQFPDQSAGPENVEVEIVNTASPQGFEFRYNLASNNNINSASSFIDTEQTKFIYDGLDTIGVGVDFDMISVGNQSGMAINSVVGQKNAANRLTLTVEFTVTGALEGSLFTTADSIGDFLDVRLLPDFNNPNIYLSPDSANLLGNVGRFNENFNGGLNVYESDSFALTAGGNAATAIDFSQQTAFTALINTNGAAFDNDTNISFRAFYAPMLTTDFKNVPLPNTNNLLKSPRAFNHVITPASPPTQTLLGLENSEGARLDISQINATIVGTQLQITGTFIPNANFTTMISNRMQGNRRLVVLASISDDSLDSNSSNISNTILFDGQMEINPILGTELTEFREVLFDHDNNNITSVSIPNTTTGDDLLYNAFFTLDKNITYLGLNTRIYMYNSTTNEEFTLEETFFNFSNVPLINGIYEVNESSSRPFLLPDTFNRKRITLTRNAPLDSPTKFGVELNYGFLNDWRFWEELTTVNNDFFDLSMHFNGRNRNWQRFSADPNWEIRLGVFPRRENNIEDFHNYTFLIRPYNDEPKVTRTTTYALQDGTAVSSLIANELIRVTEVLQWNQNWDQEWFEVVAQRVENQRVGYMSSVLDAEPISQGILEPITGDTNINVVINGNTATLQYNINLLSLSDTQLNLEVRAFSFETPTDGIQFEDGYFVEFEDGDFAQFE